MRPTSPISSNTSTPPLQRVIPLKSLLREAVGALLRPTSFLQRLPREARPKRAYLRSGCYGFVAGVFATVAAAAEGTTPGRLPEILALWTLAAPLGLTALALGSVVFSGLAGGVTRLTRHVDALSHLAAACPLAAVLAPLAGALPGSGWDVAAYAAAGLWAVRFMTLAHLHPLAAKTGPIRMAARGLTAVVLLAALWGMFLLPSNARLASSPWLGASASPHLRTAPLTPETTGCIQLGALELRYLADRMQPLGTNQPTPTERLTP